MLTLNQGLFSFPYSGSEKVHKEMKGSREGMGSCQQVVSNSILHHLFLLVLCLSPVPLITISVSINTFILFYFAAIFKLF